MSTWPELVAVVLGLAYLLLAIREKRSCWVAGGLASLLFAGIFQASALPMQALLQLFYVAMAVHGWLYWGSQRDGEAVPVSRFRAFDHVLVVLAIALLSVATLFARDALTEPRAILDTASSWGGVLATWMVVRKKLDSWLYWIVIDAATVALYISAGLLASSALYGLYTVLAFIGWQQWRRSYRLTSGV